MGNCEATDSSCEAKKHKENYDWNENTTFKLADSTGPPNNLSFSLQFSPEDELLGKDFSFIPMPPKKERGEKAWKGFAQPLAPPSLAPTEFPDRVVTSPTL
jgi:hypothetical protein